MLGTNGGGFFNANSAHPFENPTPFSNFLQIISIFIIPAGLTYTLGTNDGIAGSRLGGAGRDVRIVCRWILGSVLGRVANLIRSSMRATDANRNRSSGNMEGKEVGTDCRKRTFRHDYTDAQLRSRQWRCTIALLRRRHGAAGQHHAGEWSLAGVGRGHVRHLILVVLSCSLPASWWAAPRSTSARRSSLRREAFDAVCASSSHSSFFPDRMVCALAGPTACPQLQSGPHGLTQILYAFYFWRRQQPVRPSPDLLDWCTTS